MGRRSLPRGIAVVRVQTPFGRIVVWSDALTEDEARTARLIAFQRIQAGARAVVVSMLDVAAAIAEAA